ncbi:hypothetical protein PPL_12108 [Heterostelium album PN500]|uniref:DDE-1 domain-containing protein n=1 Tax=Heterostelium pallidum (strain ATCC 26659 / Pp 5 / PN500) TaxID=670386 RepID=D3BLQ5_HETP5|nr:hypothetical protein PPL_12108 [Heterostelium album PN500]EFA77506.1 hypothetical protein PPL_12108 [Heterostelium album PN500]|eukprot:XP_020429634.1 hypothetical protein PPL_12108 [Heterostelium album PN500]
MIGTITASGHALPPYNVLQIPKRAKWEHMQNSNYGVIIANESGYVTQEIKKEYVEWLLGQFKKTDKKLLLVDNHISNYFFDEQKLCDENNLIIMKFPSNLTHILQPLDLVLFSSFSQHLSNLLRDGLMVNPKFKVNDKHYQMLAYHSWSSSFNSSNIRMSWIKSGLFNWMAHEYCDPIFLKKPKKSISKEIAIAGKKEIVPANAQAMTQKERAIVMRDKKRKGAIITSQDTQDIIKITYDVSKKKRKTLDEEPTISLYQANLQINNTTNNILNNVQSSTSQPQIVSQNTSTTTNTNVAQSNDKTLYYQSEMEPYVQPSKNDWDLLKQIFSLEYEIVDDNSDQSKIKKSIDQIDSLKLTNLCDQLINSLALKQQKLRGTSKHQQKANKQQQLSTIVEPISSHDDPLPKNNTTSGTLYNITISDNSRSQEVILSSTQLSTQQNNNPIKISINSISFVNNNVDKVNDLQTKLDQSEANVNELQTKLNQSETKLNELQTKLDQSEANVNELQTKLNLAEVEINRLKSVIMELVQRHIEKIEQYEQALEEYKKKCSLLESELVNNKKTLEECLKEYDQLNELIKTEELYHNRHQSNMQMFDNMADKESFDGFIRDKLLFWKIKRIKVYMAHSSWSDPRRNRQTDSYSNISKKLLFTTMSRENSKWKSGIEPSDFTKEQLQYINAKNKGHRWSDMMLDFAHSLRFYGKGKGVINYIRGETQDPNAINLKLPGISVLNYNAAPTCIYLDEEDIKTNYSILSNSCSDPKQKIGGLVYDEMEISHGLYFNERKDQIYGLAKHPITRENFRDYIHLPQQNISGLLAKKVIQFFYVSLDGTISVPIARFPTTSITVDQAHQCISMVMKIAKESDFNIAFTSSDGWDKYLLEDSRFNNLIAFADIHPSDIMEWKPVKNLMNDALLEKLKSIPEKAKLYKFLYFMRVIYENFNINEIKVVGPQGTARIKSIEEKVRDLSQAHQYFEATAGPITDAFKTHLKTSIESLQSLFNKFPNLLKMTSILGTNVVENYFSIIRSFVLYPNVKEFCQVAEKAFIELMKKFSTDSIYKYKDTKVSKCYNNQHGLQFNQKTIELYQSQRCKQQLKELPLVSTLQEDEKLKLKLIVGNNKITRRKFTLRESTCKVDPTQSVFKSGHRQCKINNCNKIYLYVNAFTNHQFNKHQINPLTQQFTDQSCISPFLSKYSIPDQTPPLSFQYVKPLVNDKLNYMPGHTKFSPDMVDKAQSWSDLVKDFVDIIGTGESQVFILYHATSNFDPNTLFGNNMLHNITLPADLFSRTYFVNTIELIKDIEKHSRYSVKALTTDLQLTNFAPHFANGDVLALMEILFRITKSTHSNFFGSLLDGINKTLKTSYTQLLQRYQKSPTPTSLNNGNSDSQSTPTNTPNVTVILHSAKSGSYSVLRIIRDRGYGIHQYAILFTLVFALRWLIIRLVNVDRSHQIVECGDGNLIDKSSMKVDRWNINQNYRRSNERYNPPSPILNASFVAISYLSNTLNKTCIPH